MGDDYAPPPGPPPNQSGNVASTFAGSSNMSSFNPFRRAHASPQDPHPSDAPPAYGAPAGVPPGPRREKQQHQDEYAPSPGPPLGRAPRQDGSGVQDYAVPPPGPPPGYPAKTDDYAPPPGPPPSHNEPEPPPYDPWLAIPDNALLPPPPSLKDERSPTANASWDDAARAHDWCRRNPLWPAQQHTPAALQRIQKGHIGLTTPPNTKNVSIERGLGTTHLRTTPRCGDTIFLSDLPLYTAFTQSPKTIYFELKVLSMGHVDPRTGEADAGIAIGFVSPPYPSWRLPGWERASIGVHGDDGRRYADDSYGGQEFVGAFRPGQVVGIGMTIALPQRTDIFFTRNGKKEGGWVLQEERDSDEKGGDVAGLEGRNDILAAVGCFGGVEAEVRFRREEWLFRP